jgi:hypothetical protein
VADVQLLDVGDRGDRLDIEVGEPMARVHGEAKRLRVARGRPELLEGAAVLPPAMGVPSGVQLDRGHAEGTRGVDRGRLGVDEEAHAGAGVGQPGDGLAEATGGVAEVEAALGRDLLAALGDDGRLIGLEAARERHDVLAGGELEVEHRADGRAQALDVGIVDVTPVLAQVRRDSVGSRLLAQPGGRRRVGLVGPPCLPQRRHVIDVDVEPEAAARHCSRVPRPLCSHSVLCCVSIP